MGVKIGFTKSNYFLSDIICQVTDEPVSHCIVIVDDEWVVHSNMKGVHAERIEKFKENNEIRFSVDMPEISVKEVYDLLAKYKNSSYDFGGFLFLGAMLWLRKHCPRLVPKQNLWQQSGMFLCTEFVTKLIDKKENSEITPYKLYLKLRDRHLAYV